MLILGRLSVLTDLNLTYMAPDPTLFPNVPSGVQLHSGFAIEHQKTAPKILAEVKRLMAEHSSTHIILVGRFRNASELRTELPYDIDWSLPGRSARGARYNVHEA